uniref:Putative antisense repressor of transposase n=1 Tax=Actinobacillus pleuropneumoniae TaxID=715 RepID=A8UZH6_ACTPL|nr:putative antisense repressor of transposase [Actinobacillus pleuropneumoniae]
MSKATAILRRNGTVVQMVGYLNFATFFMMIFCMPCFAFVAQFATGFAFAYIKQP